MYLMSDTWTSWFFLRSVEQTTGGLPPSLSLPQPLSKELVGFLKNQVGFCEEYVFGSQELGSTVGSKQTPYSGVQSFSQLLQWR